MPDPHSFRRPSSAVPLIAVALAGACRSEVEPANNVAAAASPKAPPSPTERAQLLVLERLGTVPRFRFGPVQVFTNGGATIVCGGFQIPGQAHQRYIAVGEQDVFVESQMEPGHMDQAVTEFCRNA